MTRRRTLLADFAAAGTLLAAALLFVAIDPEQAHAAEFTDLLDAADDFDDLDVNRDGFLVPGELDS